MNSEKQIKKLFNSSGCLNTESILAYLENKLTIEDIKIVEGHLSSCEFCADALDGFSGVEDRESIQPALDKINAEIMRKVKSRSDKEKILSRKRISRKTWTYVSAAASVILLIGLFFIFNQIIKERPDQMAMIADSISIEEGSVTETDMPVYEEDSRSSSGEESETPEHSDQTALVVGGIMVREDEGTGTHEMETEHDGDITTEELSGADNEIGEIKGIEATEITRYDVMGVEAQEPLTGLAAGAIQKNEEIVLDEVALESPDQAVSVLSGKSTEDNKNAREKSKEKKTDRYASARNNREALTAASVVYDEDSTVFTIVEEMPEYNGGVEAIFYYIHDSLNYPETALTEEIEGTVIVSFIVEKDGSLSEIEVFQSLMKECDQEAIRLVTSMPNWIPGKKFGEPVRVFYTLPIEFKLPE